MPSDPDATMINTLAIQEMLNLPKLYGPNGFVSTAAPPADLVATLEQLETAVVDPGLLTGSQTVASVEAQTLSDLNLLASATRDELAAANGPVGDVGREALLFDFEEAPTVTANLDADASLFTPASAAPPVTVIDPPPAPSDGAEQYLVTNTTTGVSDWENGQFYSGPVTGLQNEFVTTTTDSLNITATKPNNFIHTGAGNDAISVSQFGEAGGGTNVLDGGGGSNFLVGSPVLASNDSFFLDDRAPTSNLWSTIINLHAGDSATVWGVTPAGFTLSWFDGLGAPGYTGLTLSATSAAEPSANLTLVGFTSADLTNGKLTVTYGTTAANGGVPGSAYMYVHAN